MKTKKRIKKLEKQVRALMSPANTFANGRIENWQKLARLMDCKK